MNLDESASTCSLFLEKKQAQGQNGEHSVVSNRNVLVIKFLADVYWKI